MAMHAIDNHVVAFEALVHKLFEHYSLIASKDGLSFEEYLARRVAVKVREFNTGINEPGLTDNLKQDFKDEGADKYRKASDGE